MSSQQFWYAVDQYEVHLDSAFSYLTDGYILTDDTPIPEDHLPTYVLVNHEDEDTATLFSAYYLAPSYMPQANGMGIQFTRRLKYVLNRTHPSNVPIDLPDEATVKSVIAEELINQFQETNIEDWEVLTPSANIDVDLSVSLKNVVTLDEAATITVSNSKNHDSFILKTIQDATGSRTITWGFTIEWLSPNAQNTDADAVTVYGFTKLADGTYIGYKIGETQ